MKTKIIKVKVTNNFFLKIGNCRVFNKAKRLKSEYKLSLGKAIKTYSISRS